MRSHQIGLLALVAVSAVSASASPGVLYRFDTNVPQNIQDQMVADLEFIKTIQSSTQSDLHKQIFGAVNGADYYRFFDSRVTLIGMNECGGGNAVACVIPLFGSSKMWLTQNFVKFSHPQISRMMVVFHEARHTERANSNWPHANCPTPFLDENGQPIKSIWTGSDLAGQAACDSTPFGSYGSSMIMLKNVSKFCTSCTDKVKMDAGIYADDQFKRVTHAGAKQKIIDDLYRDRAL